jgi:hypothetical protein
MWEEYLSTALPTNDSQIKCLRYILSHGVKEMLVARCQLWPGVHAAKQLLTGSKLAGDWFNSTEWTRARDAESRKQRPKPVRKNDYYERYELSLAPIDPWAHLSPEEYRQRIREMAQEIEEEARIARQGRKPLGAKAVMRVPLNHKTELPPQPWFEDRRRMVCWSGPRSPETKAYLARYWHFQHTFRSASALLLSGKLDAEFPPGSFRPVPGTEAAIPT